MLCDALMTAQRNRSLCGDATRINLRSLLERVKVGGHHRPRTGRGIELKALETCRNHILCHPCMHMGRRVLWRYLAYPHPSCRYSSTTRDRRVWGSFHASSGGSTTHGSTTIGSRGACAVSDQPPNTASRHLLFQKSRYWAVTGAEKNKFDVWCPAFSPLVLRVCTTSQHPLHHPLI